jgi:hypothetical protein
MVLTVRGLGIQSIPIHSLLTALARTWVGPLGCLFGLNLLEIFSLNFAISVL